VRSSHYEVKIKLLARGADFICGVMHIVTAEIMKGSHQRGALTEHGLEDQIATWEVRHVRKSIKSEGLP